MKFTTTILLVSSFFLLFSQAARAEEETFGDAVKTGAKVGCYGMGGVAALTAPSLNGLPKSKLKAAGAVAAYVGGACVAGGLVGGVVMGEDYNDAKEFLIQNREAAEAEEARLAEEALYQER